jgi:hypothetical protein
VNEVRAFGDAYDLSLDRMREEQQFKSIREGQLEDGTNTEVYQIRCALLFHPLFGELIRDARILDRVETVIGENLRVIPEVHYQLWDHEGIESAGYAMSKPDEGSAMPVEIKAGQMMFHHGATPHRTLPNTTDSPRRALAIHYMDATVRLGGNREAEPLENTLIVRGQVGSCQQSSLQRIFNDTFRVRRKVLKGRGCLRHWSLRSGRTRMREDMSRMIAARFGSTWSFSWMEQR